MEINDAMRNTLEGDIDQLVKRTSPDHSDDDSILEEITRITLTMLEEFAWDSELRRRAEIAKVVFLHK